MSQRPSSCSGFSASHTLSERWSLRRIPHAAHRAVRHAIRDAGVLLIAALSMPLPAVAGAVLVSPHVDLQVQAHFISKEFSVEHALPLEKIDGRTVLGAPLALETFQQVDFEASNQQWWPFPLPAFGPARESAFASARIDANGAGAVGVSGTLQSLRNDDQGSLLAFARLDTVVQNLGDEHEFLSLRLQIPRMELVLQESEGEARYGLFGDGTGVFAAIDVKPVDTSGAGEPPYRVLDLSIQLNASRSEMFDIGLFSLRGAAVHRLTDPYMPGTSGIRVDPFETEVDLGSLGPGDTLEITYTMLAYLQGFGHPVADGVAGGHAFFGDPFAIVGDGAARLSFPPVTIVPLPAGAGLFCSGLLVLLGTRRRPRSRSPTPLSRRLTA